MKWQARVLLQFTAKTSKAERGKITLWMTYYKEREKREVKCLLSVLSIPVAELRWLGRVVTSPLSGCSLWQLELEPWLPLEGRCLSSWLACQPNPIVVNPGPCCLSVCTIPAHLSSSRALFLPFSSPPTSTLRPEACDLFVFSRLLCETWGRKKRKCLFFTCEPTISF